MTTLPRWDTTALFAGLDDPRLASATEGVRAELGRLQAFFDEHDIGGGPAGPTTPEVLATIEAALPRLNAALTALGELSSYAYAFTSTDSHDAAALSLAARLQTDASAARVLRSRLTAWVARYDLESLLTAGPHAAEHAWPLARMAQQAEHQMTDAEEDLASELSITGGGAWGRLHGAVTSELEATVVVAGTPQRLPMAAVRGLATSADAATRRAAYDAELAAWPSVATPLAAAINAIKREAVALYRRRRWSSPLDGALFGNSVDRPTFDAMQAAIDDALPAFRRWFLAKARLLGHDGPLPWWDLFAPLPGREKAVDWNEATEVVRSTFARYSPALARVVTDAVEQQWIDAEPREGKRDGAFCMSFTGARSLVLMNWNGSVSSTRTLAHELGHAYHNVQLAPRTALQRGLPMALAETASIFCETLATDAVLAAAAPHERLAVLDAPLIDAAQVVVDIRSRFLFESAVFERVGDGFVGVDALNGLMLAAQQDSYGDALHPDHRHPYMWAVKSHYYSTHFYNWPYTFGQLFGMGLHARFQAEPDRFRDGYDDLLASTGMGDAAGLAARFGIDLHDQAFWAASLGVLTGWIDEYERLAG